MIRIRTGSRLHLGLLSISMEHATPWLNHEGQPTLPRRNFGGVGLMIDRPGIELSVEAARDWSAEGPLAERALALAHTFCLAANINHAFSVRVTSAAPEHAGLGTGTQLGLALARALAELTGQSAYDAVSLARKVGRGLRSAIGVHGFDRGGLLIEGGKTEREEVSPLLLQEVFPEDWCVLLIVPRDLQGTHGARERDAFRDLALRTRDDRTTDVLCRIVLLGILPALANGDLQIFGEAIYDFNRRVGELFHPAQGGLYAHPRVEQMIKQLRELGIKGVGQSSWGPTVFAIQCTEHTGGLRDLLVRKQIAAPEEILIAHPLNRGATVLRA